MTFFISLQSVLLFFMVFHDWLSVPPLNNIKELKSVDSHFIRCSSSILNGLTVAIPLMLTWIYRAENWYVNLGVVLFYFILTVGTLLSWWIPYFFGSSESLKKQFMKFNKTHHFLPPIKDHTIPNTLHVLMHLQVWMCFGFACYFMLM